MCRLRPKDWLVLLGVACIAVATFGIVDAWSEPPTPAPAASEGLTIELTEVADEPTDEELIEAFCPDFTEEQVRAGLHLGMKSVNIVERALLPADFNEQFEDVFMATGYPKLRTWLAAEIREQFTLDEQMETVMLHRHYPAINEKRRKVLAGLQVKSAELGGTIGFQVARGKK